MECRLLIVSLFLACTSAQIDMLEQIPVPCTTDDTCTSSIADPTLDFKCSSGVCWCKNATEHKYEFCKYNETRSSAPATARAHGQLVVQHSCESDKDCTIEGSRCLDAGVNRKICQCDSELRMNANGTACLKVATIIGAKCNETLHCHGGHPDDFACIDGYCRCAPGRHYSQSRKQCVPIKGLGEECTKEEHSCYQWSDDENKNVLRCSSKNFCKCLVGYKNVDGLCRSGATRLLAQISMLVVFILSVVRMS